jgi:hypothetical protein
MNAERRCGERLGEAEHGGDRRSVQVTGGHLNRGVAAGKASRATVNVVTQYLKCARIYHDKSQRPRWADAFNEALGRSVQAATFHVEP